VPPTFSATCEIDNPSLITHLVCQLRLVAHLTDTVTHFDTPRASPALIGPPEESRGGPINYSDAD
jgi:hypothetical protein